MTERVTTTVRFESGPWAALERYVRNMRRTWPQLSRNEAINRLIETHPDIVGIPKEPQR